MAEVTGLRNAALPYPVYGVPFGVTFPILDADGDLVTGAAGLDTEVSKNGDTFADCTNESVEIATASGVYYILLTATEMTADIVSIIIKTSTSGAKTTVITLHPRKLVPLRAGTAGAGVSAGSIILDSGASEVDDFYNGCLVVGVLDSVTEARIITDYTGSTKAANVTPDWNTTPDSDDTFTIYLPEGVQINQANTTLFGDAAVDAILKRDWSSVTGEAARSALNALRFLRNKWTLTGTTLSVKKEDDATEAWSATVTTSPSAEPIVGNDPA